jgi:uncharacterized protein
MSETIRNTVARVVEASPARFGVLYGSHAEGTPRPFSDVDVAVYMDDFDDLLDLSVALEEALGDVPLDLVNLKDKPALFYYEVLASGEVLAIRDQDFFQKEKYRVMREYLDFKWTHERIMDDMFDRIEKGTYGRRQG